MSWSSAAGSHFMAQIRELEKVHILTRIPKFVVLERRRGLVAQGFPVRSGCIFFDAAQ
jgi:hypothetical protein